MLMEFKSKELAKRSRMLSRRKCTETEMSKILKQLPMALTEKE